MASGSDLRLVYTQTQPEKKIAVFQDSRLLFGEERCSLVLSSPITRLLGVLISFPAAETIVDFFSRTKEMLAAEGSR